MKRITPLLLASLVISLVVLYTFSSRQAQQPPGNQASASQTIDNRTAALERKAARADYFFRMLRDPATNAIPSNIRLRELAYARTLPKFDEGASKTSAAVTFNWIEAGPTDVGGRTRGLAVDVASSNTILAGGTSGGIWKSTNNGATWTLKSDASLAISFLAQDPRAGQTATWYAATGEFSGSFDNNGGSGAGLYGSGFYKSTDNGETWQQIIAPPGDPTSFDQPLDYVSKAVVSPTTGSVFIASNGYGMYRSADAGASFNLALGAAGEHSWGDVAIASDGSLVAALSADFNGDAQTNYGIHRSTDDGQTWTNITPNTFPASSDRTVIAIAPSNPDVAYAMTFTGIGQGASEEVSFHKITPSTGASEDRSANLPNFGGETGFLDTQGSYNMVLAVKPDDENFVLLGGTNLFRSRDGFATAADQLTENWIAGYATANDVSLYINHHPDQHSLAFDPANANAMWSGHDGGLSYVADITTMAAEVPWQKKNNGYNVTQYYGIAQAAGAGDGRLYGGTQDNGSPYFRFDGATATASEDKTTGDGGYAYLGTNFAIGSTQNGSMQLSPYDNNGDPENFQLSPDITPPNAANQLFINPFAVDPTTETIIYYAGGDVLWRGDISATVNDNNNVPNWTDLPNVGIPGGYGISALTASTTHTLYVGASSPNDPPRLFRLDNANTATDGEVERSVPGADNGAYLHSIAVNPQNADEILVLFSNYNVVGLHHSTDGGQTYTAIEGNLTGDQNNPGPSIRSATILPFNNETTYVVGTSTGAYSTTQLDGANTSWTQESANGIGNVVAESVISRTSDGRIAVGTHGRGIFLGTPAPSVAIEDEPDEQPRAFTLAQNYPNPFNPTTTIAFTLAQPGAVTLSVYDLSGRKIADLFTGAPKAPGQHTVAFDADNLASGTYLYTLEATTLEITYRETRTMTVVK